MKRFLSFLLPAATLFMVSCLKEKPAEKDPMEPGILIYEDAEDQHVYSMHPLNAAFRLNIALIEGEGKSMDELNKMEVTVDGKEYNLVEYLFGKNVTIEAVKENADKYMISCLGSRDVNTGNAYGYIKVDTGGKLLGDLEEGEVWTVTLDKGLKFDTFEYYVPSREGYFYPHDILKAYDYKGFIAAGTTPNSWGFSFSDVKYGLNNQDKLSLWSGSFIAVQKNGTGLSLDDCRASEFEFYGNSEGKSFRGMDMAYDIPASDPFNFVPTCSAKFLTKGMAVAEIAEHENIKPSEFPSRKVEIEWKGDKSNCKGTLTIHYNGKSKDYSY